VFHDPSLTSCAQEICSNAPVLPFCSTSSPAWYHLRLVADAKSKEIESGMGFAGVLPDLGSLGREGHPGAIVGDGLAVAGQHVPVERRAAVLLRGHDVGRDKGVPTDFPSRPPPVIGDVPGLGVRPWDQEQVTGLRALRRRGSSERDVDKEVLGRGRDVVLVQIAAEAARPMRTSPPSLDALNASGFGY
jgi:hypothetical protein